MRRDFLAGYEAQSGFTVEAGRGRALLAMYESVEALAMARRRARGSGGDPPGASLRWRYVLWATRVGLGDRVSAVRALRRQH